MKPQFDNFSTIFFFFVNRKSTFWVWYCIMEFNCTITINLHTCFSLLEVLDLKFHVDKIEDRLYLQNSISKLQCIHIYSQHYFIYVYVYALHCYIATWKAITECIYRQNSHFTPIYTLLSSSKVTFYADLKHFSAIKWNKHF